MSSCLLIQRTSKHLGHIPLHIFLDKRYNTLAQLLVLYNLPKGQVELRVGQGKKKTHLPIGQVHLNLFSCPAKVGTIKVPKRSTRLPPLSYSECECCISYNTTKSYQGKLCATAISLGVKK